MWTLPLRIAALGLFHVGLARQASIRVAEIVAPSSRAWETIVDSDPAALVNLFIGTTAGGHAFPGIFHPPKCLRFHPDHCKGATVPHGMVKAGMDTDSPGNHAGYDANPAYLATGFSQLHETGTGGDIPLSNFKLWPLKAPRKILPNGAPDDEASPGYFATNLTTGVRVELTATRRTALHRYTFPAASTNPRIIVDITNDGKMSAREVVMKINGTTGRVVGGATFDGSFGPGSYRAYTCVDFQSESAGFVMPTEFGAWSGDTPKKGTRDNSFDLSTGSQVGALLTFPQSSTNRLTSILARVGVSLISIEQACANAEAEIPHFDFEAVKDASRSQWNDILKRIRVDPVGVPRDTVELFYSSLYRTHIVPADYTGENPKWNSTEPYYDSFYCNWDTYRTLFPLMSLHDPENFAKITRGMIDIQKHEGFLPECRSATVMQHVQGGSNGDPILAEFYVKFSHEAAHLNVSSSDLYLALLADAENSPQDWELQGRQIKPWRLLNYIPSDKYDGEANTRQVSRTLEYAFDDFAISQVSKLLGKVDDHRKYSRRASNFLNVWNPNVTVPGAKEIRGMMQPRLANGVFDYTDPRHCSIHDPDHSTCYLDSYINTDGFYEGSPIVYVPHDTAKLIELQGGKEKFISRLDFIFNQSYFEPTDEPSLQMPFMYHYANRPGLSTQRSRQVIAEFFNTSSNGLPGNDDKCYTLLIGAMGSYVAFLLAGLYPLPATNQILLSSPFFPQVSFRNPLFGTTTTIRSKGFVGNPPSGTGGKVFIKSVSVNGRPYKSNCYLDWDVFVAGSLVELTLTDDINVTCGEGVHALPPSLSTGGYD
ncbi:hypothetical protein EYR40_009749 [Pleurotus pulmonarius]|nr:hypothetical protein EYR38_002791 [Pleurotus pulmonarius]KAF4591147.1 hypothetical protein EYR40_009749 [Pleurotus pulmonarius]